MRVLLKRQPSTRDIRCLLRDPSRLQVSKLARSTRTSVRLVERARIVLLAADGVQTQDIAAQLGISRGKVARWRGRYAEQRWGGIEQDLPRGAPLVKVDVARLVELTTQTQPEAATHWSTRTMAAALGVSAASISRHSRAHAWPEAPFGAQFQDLAGSALCRETRRHRRPVSRAAPTRAGALL